MACHSGQEVESRCGAAAKHEIRVATPARAWETLRLATAATRKSRLVAALDVLESPRHSGKSTCFLRGAFSVHYPEMVYKAGKALF